MSVNVLLLLFCTISIAFGNHMFLNPDYRDIIGQDYWDKLTENAVGEENPCYNRHCPIGYKCFSIPNPKCRRIECPMTPTCVNIGNAGGIPI
uniref:WAP domain-containing protein n=1 Tax=Steinernema glaseri TaxID=37863 RepID=A0A1I7YGG6_9BILA